MDKYFAITFKFFNNAMNLIDYMEKSSTSLMELLNDIPDSSAFEERQKKNYENLLKRINKRSKSIKSDLLNTIEKQIYLMDEKQVSAEFFSVINTEIENLNEIANQIITSEHYVDKDGRLQQR